MVQRVIVQTQSEYADMNRRFIKYVFFIGTLIAGIVLLVDTNLTFLGLILLFPFLFWIGLKIKKKYKKILNKNKLPKKPLNRWERINNPSGWIFKKAKTRMAKRIKGGVEINGEHYRYRIYFKKDKKKVYRMKK